MQPRLAGHTELGAFHHATDTAEQRPLICETHCQSAARGNGGLTARPNADQKLSAS